MKKQDHIAWIEKRIKSEYTKHKKLDFAKIAAHKIVAQMVELGLIDKK